MACLLKTDASGQTVKDVRTFSTMTADLRRLADWLRAEGCQHVALESTGVYWKPVHNLLEGVCTEVLLVNAQHVKNVPGRKTDVKDAEWLATLLRAGLLRGSFIPPKEIRDLRELTRYRSTVIQQRAAECNRIQKLLENGNIKLASVASDVLGKSGQAMLRALVEGRDDPETLAQLAQGRLRAKIPELTQALQGLMSSTQRWLLGEQLQRIADLDEAIDRLNEQIGEPCRPFEAALLLLDAIPRVNRRVAQTIIAEIGVDMSRFPTDNHLASWAGMRPGNHESAGKHKSGRTRKGCSWLRAVLMEAAWGARRCKKRPTYLAAQYQRLARRRGKKRAVVAVGHSILCMVHTLLLRPRAYEDLGADYFERRGEDKVKDQLVRRLRQLGYDVTLTKPEPAVA
jgi:transposase